MSNSSLVDYIKLSPNHSGARNHVADTITIHCMAGNLSVEACGDLFARTSTQASSNYGVGTDGRIALYVEEKNRSWATSSSSNDNRAITIEVANDGGEPDWHVSDKALASTIKLITDICKRNGIKKLLWQNNPNLIGQVDKQNMTLHRWFAAKACPGDYLISKHPYIVEQVNKSLGANITKQAYTKKMPVLTAKRPVLKKGMKNLQVQRLQKFLNWYFDDCVVDGRPLETDKIFGENTRKGVFKFQQDMFPNEPGEWDGEVGPRTVAKMKTFK